MSAWAARYEELALAGVRSREVTDRIALHLHRFAEYLLQTYGHDRLATVVRRDVAGWRDALVASGLGPSTVNNHLASLAGFCGWVTAQAPDALPGGNPTSGVRTLALAPLEPRALTPAQVRSLKSVVDRLERFHAPKGRRNHAGEAQHGHARAMRDRAIVYVLLSTGLRREELVTLDIDQVKPARAGSAARSQADPAHGRSRQGRHDAHGVPLGRRQDGARRLSRARAAQGRVR